MGDNDAKSVTTAERLFQRCKIVLVGTTHPGNIGASARAMKTMGITRLCLVEPKQPPNAEAFALAAGANDVLERAETFGSLADAVAECTYVVGTTARARSLAWPVEPPRPIAEAIGTRLQRQTVALVFGREQSGLSNAELQQCHQLIRIPTDAAFSSLNLAQAVQVCAYELRVAVDAAVARRGDAVISVSNGDSDPADPPATNEEVNRLFEHWLQIMSRVAYFNPNAPKLLPQRLRRVLNRAALTAAECRMLRGFLTAVGHSTDGRGSA